MYEFTDKEIRKEFHKTEYGKKVNLYIIVGYILFFVTLLSSVLLTILTKQNFFDVIYAMKVKTFDNLAQKITFICYGACMISIILLVYFDGKRDGAITEYKSKKNK